MTGAMNSIIKEGEKSFPEKEKQDETRYPIMYHQNRDSIWKQRPTLCDFLMSSIFLMLMGTLVLLFLQPPPSYLSTDSINDLSHGLDRFDVFYGGQILQARSYTPEQLHLSLGSKSNEIYVTWTTKMAIEGEGFWVEICKFHPTKGCIGPMRKISAKMYEKEFLNTDESWLNLTRIKRRTITSYRALVQDLETGSIYIYRAVSEIKQTGKWYSKTYQFLAKDFSDPYKPVKLAFYGDLGLINGQSLDSLIEEVDFRFHDLIIHNGDFAYDLNTHNGEYGDEFMRMIEPIAARVPYQTSVGNHEIASNFSHYDHRFTMVNSGGHDVGKRNNFYYSFNAGPIHFIGFSTEFYYFLETAGLDALSNQYNWLKEDLELASSPQERSKRPWIIVFGHRPMYCSSRDDDDCSKETNLLRKGLPFTGAYALEKLFYDYGVDVQLYSHEHMYERFLPIYDGQVYLGANKYDTEDFLNPGAPIHIISGSAGCQERLDPFKNNTVPGSVKQISDYGFLRIRASRCKIHFEQFSTDEFKIVDEFFIQKTHTQNFPTKKGAVTLNCTMNEQLNSCPGPGWSPCLDDQCLFD